MATGVIYCVGLGPGGEEHMTAAAREAVLRSQVVVGYQTYIDLIPGLLGGKRILSSGMRKELERCQQAIDEAKKGAVVSLISSGDPGIYGMAGLVLELNHEGIEIEIVPGVSAVQAAASRLGAPLMNDFAVISLSNLLTPWPKIARRLHAVAGADMVLGLYNPRSQKRVEQLEQARDILLTYRSPDTPVGIVRNACREEEAVFISTLAEFTKQPIDMFTTVIIGNSETRYDGTGRIFTPRGYREKYLSEPKKQSGSRALFVGGTGSDVGKSVISAGLCRIFARKGSSVAPFKAQNMALNSAVTAAGGEIGRAQALQAAACELDPHTDMNPVLLKPNTDTGSQVIIQGRPVGNMSVAEYQRYKPTALTKVRESFHRLADRHELIVIEGAGSVSEINLKKDDIANLAIAEMADARVILVADIDRGGVFATLVGTIELMTEAERARLGGIIINRFRGDASLLKEGIEALETRTGVPVLGVIPWIDLRLPEEDSVALGRREQRQTEGRKIKIGILRLPRISNYTDFDALGQEPDVTIKYIENPFELQGVDLLIIPGTKSTLADLSFMRQRGLIRAVTAYHANGGKIIGICGGYQILGKRVLDPDGVESSVKESAGLGLLDVVTTMQPRKQTHQAEGVLMDGAKDAGFMEGGIVRGYEIHMGETVLGPQARPFACITKRSGEDVNVSDGAVSADGRVWGTYLHGIFDDDMVRSNILATLAPGQRKQTVSGALIAELDRLADHLQAHLDMAAIERLISGDE